MPSRIHTFKNANVPKTLKLPKGKLVKIDWKEHTDEIKKILEDKRRGGSLKSRMARIQKLVGYGNNIIGYCCKCRELNSHIQYQKHISGAIVITRFCEQHVPS